MEPEPKDVIVLSAISMGAKKFDKIEKVTKIFGQELNDMMERLEKNGLITVIEKKGFFGPKKEIVLTEKGHRELEERKFELQKTGIRWLPCGRVETSRNCSNTWTTTNLSFLQ